MYIPIQAFYYKYNDNANLLLLSNLTEKSHHQVLENTKWGCLQSKKQFASMQI